MKDKRLPTRAHRTLKICMMNISHVRFAPIRQAWLASVAGVMSGLLSKQNVDHHSLLPATDSNNECAAHVQRSCEAWTQRLQAHWALYGLEHVH